MARPRTYKVSLSEEEYSTLKKISRCKKTSKIRKLRCQILLDLDDAHGSLPLLMQERNSRHYTQNLNKCRCNATLVTQTAVIIGDNRNSIMNI